MLLPHDPWIQTMEGEAFSVVAPDPAKISLSTIAIVLSRLCRFGGHCRQFYSVADHSVRVCCLVKEQTQDPALQLAAILHDAHEAYSGFGDVARPAKSLSHVIDTVHCGIDQVVAERFRFDPALFAHPLIRLADDTLLATELRDLMRDPPQPWPELPEPHPVRIIPYTMHDAAWRFECVARKLVFTVQGTRRPTDESTTQL